MGSDRVNVGPGGAALQICVAGTVSAVDCSSRGNRVGGFSSDEDPSRSFSVFQSIFNESEESKKLFHGNINWGLILQFFCTRTN